ncbi:MAG: response regulator [Deltaproteobacteria bacterium]|nr:response regulator [Deltaproteobacteria bacterium]
MTPVASAEQLIDIIDAIPAAVAYIDAEEHFRVANKAFRGLYGPLFGDVIGHHVRDVFGPAGYEVMRPHLERVLGGHPVRYVARLPFPDGTVRWIETNYTPHPSGGFVSELHDVTPQKRIEERLNVLAEASRALVACRDRQATLGTIANMAISVLADWAAVYTLEQGAPRLVEVGHVPYLTREAVWELARELTPVAGETPKPLDFAKGTGVAVGLVARGEPLGVVVLASLHGHQWDRDDLLVVEELGRRASAALDNAMLFEQQREAMDRLQEADRRKDQFLAVLGHELRNPLAPIVTALDLMAFRGAGFERERDVIRRQSEYMTRLIDDLLDISRITRGKIELRKETVDLADVIAKAVELASPLLEQRSHKLAVDVPRGLIVDGDPVRLAQVFTNLLNNAAKYSPPRSEIAIAAAREADEASATVTDNGPGIPPELVPEVFEPFVQGKRVTDRAQGGLGLGLALVRSLTTLHGGSVELDTVPGRTTFTVRLPMAPRPAVAKVADGAAGRLLVVDDNIDAATMIAELLRTIGYEVAVAHDAPRALAIADELRPGIALIDLSLPVMDGYELARHLRTQLQHPPRLVAVTGYGQHNDVQRSRAAGFEVQLGKPVDFDQLVTVLGRLQPS